jgi:hypothetical protein
LTLNIVFTRLEEEHAKAFAKPVDEQFNPG